MVSKSKYFFIVIGFTLIFLLTACSKTTPTEDPNLKITEIAATVQAELTKVSALTPSVTSTSTPNPATATPTLGAQMTSPTATKLLSTGISGDNAAFGADITIPDGSLVLPGSTFVKTWSIVNTGTTTWNKNYQLMYIQGQQDAKGALFVKITEDVAPGASTNVSVTFTAPSAVGTYTSYWKMYSANGYSFGEQVSLLYTVSTETPTPTATGATPTLTATAATPGSGTTTP